MVSNLCLPRYDVLYFFFSSLLFSRQFHVRNEPVRQSVLKQGRVEGKNFARGSLGLASRSAFPRDKFCNGATRRSYTEIGRGAIEMKNETGFPREEISCITGREASARCLFRGKPRRLLRKRPRFHAAIKMFRPLASVCHVGKKPWIKSVVSREWVGEEVHCREKLTSALDFYSPEFLTVDLTLCCRLVRINFVIS